MAAAIQTHLQVSADDQRWSMIKPATPAAIPRDPILIGYFQTCLTQTTYRDTFLESEPLPAPESPPDER